MLRKSIDLMKENSFKLAKERSRRYPAQTITNMDYTNDIVLLANSPTQAKSLLHSLERAACGIGLHINADQTETFALIKGWSSETSEQVHPLRKQCLIN